MLIVIVIWLAILSVVGGVITHRVACTTLMVHRLEKQVRAASKTRCALLQAFHDYAQTADLRVAIAIGPVQKLYGDVSVNFSVLDARRDTQQILLSAAAGQAISCQAVVHIEKRGVVFQPSRMRYTHSNHV